MAEQVIPFFDDLLFETKTRGNEWAMGKNALQAALGMYQKKFDNMYKEGAFPFVRLARIRGGQGEPLFIARHVDIEAYNKEHPSHVPEKLATNGHMPQLVDMRSGVNLPSADDFREMKVALAENTLALKSLNNTIRENSQAAKELKEKL